MASAISDYQEDPRVTHGIEVFTKELRWDLEKGWQRIGDHMDSSQKFPPCFEMSKNKGGIFAKMSNPQNFPPAAGYTTGF